ncbi:hypothetical protein LSH36_394g02093 [Paralvinella palmiformis]|uniref:Ricin B lectin domain-containing protein n=1 Tax=Paralvinella palmiformis TaxID=53620 RepID=A0AAD9JCN1_9ANNE|nr:hypothetical protein LSH36_394g02093 [Paralvinella palmiformis]
MLDGHMEVTKGWIEPLLARIKENNKILLSSLIDMIHPNNMLYIKSDFVYQSLSWKMVFVWTHLPPGTTHDPLEPIPTYALVGCMLAMHRDTFIEMGAFDTGMELWGGENIELPIRVWMCGGRVEILPCSRVAHTYRAEWGRPWKGSIGLSLEKNAQRIAEVWLDDYKDEFYLAHQSLVKRSAAVRANVTERLALRRRLGCKSFKWLLDNVVRPPMFTYTRNVTNWGQIKHPSSNKCLDMLQVYQYKQGIVGVYPCHPPRAMGATQLFSLTKSKQLRREMHCLSSSSTVPGHNVTLNPDCREEPSQWWIYEKEQRHIVHEMTKMCLEVTPGNGVIQYVVLNRCENKTSQQWTWLTYNKTDLLHIT